MYQERRVITFLAEIASKEFVDAMSAEIKSTVSSILCLQDESFRLINGAAHFERVKANVSAALPSWALGFQSKESLSFFVDFTKSSRTPVRLAE